MTGGFGAALTLGQMLDQAAALDPSQESVVWQAGEKGPDARRRPAVRVERRRMPA